MTKQNILHSTNVDFNNILTNDGFQKSTSYQKVCYFKLCV